MDDKKAKLLEIADARGLDSWIGDRAIEEVDWRDEAWASFEPMLSRILVADAQAWLDERFGEGKYVVAYRTDPVEPVAADVR